MNWALLPAWLDRWYLGGFLLIFGLYNVVRARNIGNARRFFPCSERTPAIDAALDRRIALEALPDAVWIAPGVVNALLGAVVLAGWLSGVVAYGLGCCALAASPAFAYVRMRNRSTRRAAALAPRGLLSVIPAPWYAGALVVAFAPLVLLGDPALRLAAVFVSISCLATFACAILANRMPSLMSGEDPQAEYFVDQRLRRCRVTGLFAVGFCVPFVFMAMTAPQIHATTLIQAANFATILAWCAYVIPLLVMRKRVLGA